MATPVVTVAAGGIAVVEVPNGMPVTEAANARGMAVTKVVGKPYGIAVTFVSETGGPVVPPVTYATFDPATVTAVTLSGGNLVATNTGTTSPDQGARVASASGKTIGKYYFEAAMTVSTGGANVGFGIGTTTSTYTGIGGSATTGDVVYRAAGSIYANGSASGSSISTVAIGQWVGVAVDIDNRKIWFRQTPSGNWNGSGTANPATNTGGITIPAGTIVPFCVFGGNSGLAGGAWTANFGASVFAGAAPVGFTAGWSA